MSYGFIIIIFLNVFMSALFHNLKRETFHGVPALFHIIRAYCWIFIGGYNKKRLFNKEVY